MQILCGHHLFSSLSCQSCHCEESIGIIHLCMEIQLYHLPSRLTIQGKEKYGKLSLRNTNPILILINLLIWSNIFNDYRIGVCLQVMIMFNKFIEKHSLTFVGCTSVKFIVLLQTNSLLLLKIIDDFNALNRTHRKYSL